MVEHDDGFATRTQYAPDLSYRRRCIGRMVKHAVGVHDVEGVVRKVETFSIGYAECAWQVKQFKAASC